MSIEPVAVVVIEHDTWDRSLARYIHIRIYWGEGENYTWGLRSSTLVAELDTATGVRMIGRTIGDGNSGSPVAGGWDISAV